MPKSSRPIPLPPSPKRSPSYSSRMYVSLAPGDREALDRIQTHRRAMSWAEVIRGLIREEELRLGPQKGGRK